MPQPRRPPAPAGALRRPLTCASDPPPALAGLALTLAFGMAFRWAMLYLALTLGTEEATQAANPDVRPHFLSSAFVPRVSGHAGQ